jgi:hypothetical protein
VRNEENVNESNDRSKGTEIDRLMKEEKVNENKR